MSGKIQKLSTIVSFILFLTVASAEIRTVRVGYSSYAGINDIDSNGNPSGYTVDFLNMVSRYVNLNFTFVGYDLPMSETTRMLRDGEIDMMLSTRKTTDREETYLFSVPIGTYDISITTRSSDNRIIPDDYNSYEGISIGVLARSSNEELLRNFAASKGFSYTAVPMETMDELETALRRKEIDALISPSMRKTYNEKTLSIVSTQNMYMIFNGKEENLVNQIDYACLEMDRFDSNWKEELFGKYFSVEMNEELTFSSKEKDFMDDFKNSGQTLKVLVSASNDPYSYVEDGQMKGILPDIFAEYMEPTGLPYEFLITTNTEEYRKIREECSADVILDYELESSEANNKSYVVTPSYLDMNIAILVNKDYNGTITKCAVLKDRLTETLHMRITPEADIIPYKTREDAVGAVLRKEVDAAYLYSYYAAKAVSRSITVNLTYNVIPNTVIHCAIAVPADRDHTLAGILTKCIANTPRSTTEEIIFSNTSYSSDPIGLLTYFAAYPIIPIAMLFIMVVTFLLFRFYMTKNQLEKKVILKEKESLQNQKEYNNLINTLGQEYNPLLLLDLATDSYKTIKSKIVSPNKSPIALLIPSEGHYSELMNSYIDRFVIPEQQEKMRQAADLKVLSKCDSLAEFSFQRSLNGKTDFYQASFSKLEDSGNKNKAILGFRNVTSLMEQEFKQQQILKNALFMAEQANRAKTTFLSNMSHDIRTPMNAIIGFTRLAKKFKDKKDITEYLDKIALSGNHLLSLINNVLDMSRIESGKINLEEQEFDLQDLVGELQTIIQPQVNAKNQTLTVNISGLEDHEVVSDRLRLHQVLMNILGNAVKFTPDGGTIKFTVSQPEHTRNGFGCYEFRIKDNGIGMSTDFIQKLYNPFERERTSTVSRTQGTGLGMSITKNIVDMMDGTISVISDKGNGTEFVIRLNLLLASQKAQNENSEETSVHNEMDKADMPETPADFTGCRCLLAEDNELNREIATAILDEMGIKTDSAENGAIAITRLVEAEPGFYDFILMDIQMPAMNGYEATRRIRTLRNATLAGIPVIAMTANAFDSDRRDAMAAGMDGHISKPIDPTAVAAVLSTILKKKA